MLAVLVLYLAPAGAGQHVPWLECDTRRNDLRLERYEDGSAVLRCGRMPLARIGVPW